MEKQILKHEEKFKKWAPNNGVSAVESYMTYLREASNVSKSKSIDELLEKIVKKAIKDALPDEKFADKRKANNSRSAVKKYWDYLRHIGKDMPPKK